MLLDDRILRETEARLGPLISPDLTQRSTAPPSDLTSPRRAALVRAYVADQRSPTDENAFERAMGDIDLVGIDYLYNGLRAAEAVARIVIPRADGNRTGYATGFMVSPDLLLTNWHVLKTEQIAAVASAQFGYQADSTGAERTSTLFALRPDRFFLVNEHLDYCLVGVDPTTQKGPSPLASFGWLRLNPQLGKADYGQWASIIQHPGAQLKQLSIRENAFFPIDEASDFLSYHSDTLRGSSGAPVLNDFWEVVALHHSGVAAKDRDGHYLDHEGNPIIGREANDDEVKWIANEGARVSRIVDHALSNAKASAIRDTLEQTIRGRLSPPPGTQNGIENAVTSVGAARAPISAGGDGGSGQRRYFIPVDVAIALGDGLSSTSPAVSSVTAPSADVTGRTGAGGDAYELVFDEDYSNRTGYDDRFLGSGRRVPMPTIAPETADKVARTLAGGTQLDYYHYSLAMHATRRLAIFTACNVNYLAAERDARSRKALGKDEWRIDDRMDEKYQIPKRFYDKWKRLDYGHLVRRDDCFWGSSNDEREYANADTFHMTNCSPQHEAFNRSNLDGLWGNLEETIKAQASDPDYKISKLCVFSGPIFNDKKDLVCGDVRVPISFWKVVVAPEPGNKLKVYGFILKQSDVLRDDPPFEEFDPSEYERSFSSLDAIEAVTLVRFADVLKAVDVRRGQ